MRQCEPQVRAKATRCRIGKELCANDARQDGPIRRDTRALRGATREIAHWLRPVRLWRLDDAGYADIVKRMKTQRLRRWPLGRRRASARDLAFGQGALPSGRADVSVASTSSLVPWVLERDVVMAARPCRWRSGVYCTRRFSTHRGFRPCWVLPVSSGDCALYVSSDRACPA